MLDRLETFLLKLTSPKFKREMDFLEQQSKLLVSDFALAFKKGQEYTKKHGTF